MDGFKNFQQMPRSPERRLLQQNLPKAVLRALAADLVASNVDVVLRQIVRLGIVTVDTPPTQAAKQATIVRTFSILMTSIKVQLGPAMTFVRSITFIPANEPIASHPN